MDLQKEHKTSRVIGVVPGQCINCGITRMSSPKEKMKMSTMKTYTCPMQGEIGNKKTGSCSKCGMNLS
jgi:hypothetical protein